MVLVNHDAGSEPERVRKKERFAKFEGYFFNIFTSRFLIRFLLPAKQFWKLINLCSGRF